MDIPSNARIEGFVEFKPQDNDVVVYSNAANDSKDLKKNAMFNIQIPVPKKYK